LDFISNKWKQPSDDSLRRFPLYFFLFLAGVILTIKLLTPPSDDTAAFAFNSHYNWAHLRLALSGIGKGLLPIPPLSLHCWNNYISPGLYPEISLYVVLVFALFFWRDKKLFLFFPARLRFGFYLFLLQARWRFPSLRTLFPDHRGRLLALPFRRGKGETNGRL